MSASSWYPAASLATLRQRAAIRDLLRQHFANSACLEVEAPLCQAGPNRDRGVWVGQIQGLQRWLVSSPEHALKRLVAAGYGAVWSLHPCLRLAEQGRLHEPAFSMLEWYRPGWSLEALIDETCQLICLALAEQLPVQRLSWHQAMCLVLPRAPEDCDVATLAKCCGSVPEHAGRDELLDLCFASQVQPRLGSQGICVVDRWPAAACAQARIVSNHQGQSWAARFEVFVRGVELANGYDECSNAQEIRQRFVADAEERKEQDAQYDQAYLAALDAGLPPCVGVALGFDRLVMLACKLDRISQTMAFPWDRC